MSDAPTPGRLTLRFATRLALADTAVAETSFDLDTVFADVYGLVLPPQVDSLSTRLQSAIAAARTSMISG